MATIITKRRVKGNFTFRYRSTLRKVTLYISKVTRFQEDEHPETINGLVNNLFIATEFEDGFFADHLCYTDCYGNVFMSENEEIQKLFMDYSPSLHMMRNGMILVYVKSIKSFYITVDMENFSKFNLDSPIRYVYSTDSADCMQLKDGTVYILSASTTLHDSGVKLALITATAPTNVAMPL